MSCSIAGLLLASTPVAMQRHVAAPGSLTAAKAHLQQRRWAQVALQGTNTRLRRRAPGACRATAEKEGVQQDDKLQVPDAPPGKGASAPEEPMASSSGATSPNAEAPLSAEEIQRQMGQLRAAKAAVAKKDGLVEGVLEEVGLIKWPSPKSALLNTLLVIAIVAGTSALLFGVNALLAEVSAAVYSRH